LPVRPTKPEPFTEAEREQMRRANRIRHRERLKMFNRSASDYEAAVKFGFPRAEGQTMPTAEYCWLKTTIAEWRMNCSATKRTIWSGALTHHN
jgi:hypothetical protein